MRAYTKKEPINKLCKICDKKFSTPSWIRSTCSSNCARLQENATNRKRYLRNKISEEESKNRFLKAMGLPIEKPKPSTPKRIEYKYQWLYKEAGRLRLSVDFYRGEKEAMHFISNIVGRCKESKKEIK